MNTDREEPQHVPPRDNTQNISQQHNSDLASRLSRAKRKRLIIVAAVIIIGGAVVIGGISALVTSNHENESAENEQYELDDEYVEDEEYSDADIEWTTYTVPYNDSNGYKYEITYELSPWMLLSEYSDEINSAWSEVGKGNPLPDEIGDWGIHGSGGSYGGQIPNGNSQSAFIHSMNDMYYCIGTMTIHNVTDGWSITPDDPRTVYPTLIWEDAYEGIGKANSISRVFTSNKTVDSPDGIQNNINAHMESDTWGPRPFVIMAPENITPNYPDGEYFDYMKDGKFISYGTEANGMECHVDVYGKDGEYDAADSTR